MLPKIDQETWKVIVAGLYAIIPRKSVQSFEQYQKLSEAIINLPKSTDAILVTGEAGHPLRAILPSNNCKTENHESRHTVTIGV